ncbi:unnamed protein product [Bursaphelenchus xylophilus]|uniref:(pine wood nematode) hypothetical protein n=1 Tax=Bursaphelenchus xylophilus TaxID=6326 RepID=A0A7I8WS68_BURXY|nr:unnamed protein product [Bursaphelenchus xylophilus]CAG9115019.1 unnamed protein product [Bursaphelenchus xylophilus]
MIYNALLIIINMIAVNALIALYFVAKLGEYDQDDSVLWAMIAITILLVLIIIFSIIFEHVIVTCYRALSHSEDVEFNPENNINPSFFARIRPIRVY